MARVPDYQRSKVYKAENVVFSKTTDPDYKTMDEVKQFSVGITRFLLDQGAKMIVVACNTASAVALYPLRETFPDIPFVGMEPAVKPAAEETESGIVGVLATPATFQGALYNSVVERFASGVTILQDTCPGLVEQIERGDIYSKETRSILEDALNPMIEQGVDSIVMGCTHYPFAIPIIREIVGEHVDVIDPAPAVARQVGRLLDQNEMRNQKDGDGEIVFYTTGGSRSLRDLLPYLIGVEGDVERLSWDEDGETLTLDH